MLFLLLVSLVLMYNKTHLTTNVLYHWKTYYLINSSQGIRLLGTQGLLSQLYQILKRRLPFLIVQELLGRI